MLNFADRLLDAVDEKQNPSCVGLDPRLNDLPDFIKEEAKEEHGETFEAVGSAFFKFNKGLIDTVSGLVAVVKPQIAFYEKYGQFGVKAFSDTVNYAKKKGLIVVEDAKRSDIGSTARAYSEGHLGEVDFFNGKVSNFDVDCITVNPYLGFDGISPFVGDVKNYGKGIFVLVKTSNPSSGEFQDLQTGEGKKNYEIIAENVNKWGDDSVGERGYSSVGAVVGATYPKEAVKLRELMENAIFLVPGYGAQGGKAADVVPCFNPDGYGAIVNSSRGIDFAYKKRDWRDDRFAEAAAEAVVDMQEKISAALKEADKFPW